MLKFTSIIEKSGRSRSQLFQRIVEKSVLKNPLNTFAEETQTIELRQDPLLGTWARININRAKRVHQSLGEESGALKELIKKSRENCFFCMENVEKKTPQLPAKLGLGARVKINGFVLFPNLYPFAKYHAVGVITQKHDAKLGEITPEEWENALSGSIKYLRAVLKLDSAARFASINMNFMPPAAASIIHPHLQVICDRKPTVMQQLLHEKSRGFYKRTGKNYFEALAKEDRERRIISSKKMAWLATFSPSAANDITGIFHGRQSLFGMTESDIKIFAKELSRIFSAYDAVSSGSANMSIFSSPLGGENKFFTLHVRIISRPALQEFYTADRGFLEVLHKEPVVSAIPEELAKSMRKLIA